MSEEFSFLRPAGWAEPKGYTDGISATGRMVFVSGQVGWNPATCEFETDDFAGQAEQALANLLAVVHAAGARPENLVRLTWYVTDRERYVAARSALGAAYRRTVGSHYPAMSLVIVGGLLEQRALLEIEATVVIPE